MLDLLSSCVGRSAPFFGPSRTETETDGAPPDRFDAGARR